MTKAIQGGRTNEVVALLDSGADINAPYDYQYPLAQAADGHADLVKVMIARGAKVNANNIGLGMHPALTVAAASGSKDIAKILLENGADTEEAIKFLNVCVDAAFTDAARSRCSNGIKMIQELKRDADQAAAQAAQAARDAARAEARAAAQASAKAAADLAQATAQYEQRNFEAALRTYRAAATKPELPEQARRYKVQAEAAIRDKDFNGAATLFRSALMIAPWWPEGHFNLALVLGETGGHAAAVVEMKRYLALVPNAPDARDAQDKIYEWER
jgi:tetratricopeptide (TPR) repeat protein